jgi:hypothetical protein
MESLLVMIGLFAAFCWGLYKLWNSDGGTAQSTGSSKYETLSKSSADSIGFASSPDKSEIDYDCMGAGRAFEDDWLTDPMYSFYHGNIYHHDDTPVDGCGLGTGSDWMTDPTCSYMLGNIYHKDNLGSSSSLTEDSSSCFDSDSSCDLDSSSSFDDNWPSSNDD